MISGDINAAAETIRQAIKNADFGEIPVSQGNAALAALDALVAEVERLRAALEDELQWDLGGSGMKQIERLRAERDAVQNELRDAVLALTAIRGSFTGFLAPALSQALAEQDEEIAALRVEKQQLEEQVRER